VTLSFESDGTGTSGLDPLVLENRTVGVSGNVFQAAAGQIQTGPLNFGTVQVGQSVSQALAIRNTAIGETGFVEDLNVAFGTSSGTGAVQISGTGSIAGLLAGATDSASMIVNVNTATAGNIAGSIAVNYVSAGAVAGVSNGLGTLSVGSEDYAVSGLIEAAALVVDTAAPQINTPEPVNLGNVRVGDGSPTAVLSVTNVATGNDQAALNATISGAGPVTAAGAFDLLAPGDTDNTSLSVGMLTAAAGAVSGTATIGFVSDANNIGDCDAFCQLTLPSQTVQVTGGVYQVAQPDLPGSVDLGNFRLGDSPVGALTIANASISPDGFHEGLDAAVSATSGVAVAAGGPVSNLGAGASATDITVGVDGGAAVAGVNSGTVTLALASNGTGTSGLGLLALPDAVVDVAGTGYRTAAPVLNTASVDLAARVGDASPTAAISVSNASSDAFTESLNATARTAPAGFAANGAISGLSAQDTDDVSLSVALDTASAGAFAGTLVIDFVSSGAGTTGADDLDVGSDDVALAGRVYQAASGAVTTGDVDFGIVHVGEVVAARAVGVANTAPVAALNDTLAADFTSAGTGPFGTSGAVAGLAAGDSTATGLSVTLDTSSAGVFGASQSVAFASQNPDLADLDLGLATVLLAAQVNNYANPVFTQIGGAGALTGADLSFVLDFGLVDLGSNLTATLGVLNDIVGPADVLGGGFTLPALGAFSFVGFESFTDISASGVFGGLDVEFTAQSTGFFEQMVSLDAFGSNMSGYFGAFDTINLAVRAQVRDVAAPIPLPAGLWLLLGGLGGLVMVRRKAA